MFVEYFKQIFKNLSGIDEQPFLMNLQTHPRVEVPKLSSANSRDIMELFQISSVL